MNIILIMVLATIGVLGLAIMVLIVGWAVYSDENADKVKAFLHRLSR